MGKAAWFIAGFVACYVATATAFALAAPFPTGPSWGWAFSYPIHLAEALAKQEPR